MPIGENMPVVRIAPNNPVFDLPVIVGIEEGLFEQAGLDVSFTGTYADREKADRGKDNIQTSVMARFKENMFDSGTADSYNVCEWASIDRLERGTRGGKVAALRASVAAQAILTFDETLQVPRDMADVPVVVQWLTGSHYTALQMLESAVGADHVKLEAGGLPQKRWQGLKNGTHRAVAVQEQWRWFGVASEVAAIIQDRAFDSLDAPVERVSGAEVPGPYARNLELMAFPSEKQVTNAARRVLYEEEK